MDTTDPDQIQLKRKELPIDKTLFIVSSKSGGTAEVNALEAYFWNELIKNGIEKPGSHFIAITDPGTSLEKKGKDKEYRQVIPGKSQCGRQVFCSDRIRIGAGGSNGDRLQEINEASPKNGNCLREYAIRW